MNMTSIYEYILSRIAEDLSPYGYKRSGKSSLFYRYSADKKVGCVFEMQKSMFNSPDDYSFTFNLGCIALYNLNGYYKDKLTLETAKLALRYDAGCMRLGHLSRGCDYWWNITDEILKDFSIEEYYNRFLHPDILKAAEYLKEQAHKKESVYSKENNTVIYDSIFNFRCTTAKADTFSLANFPDLTRQRHTFPSNNGQTLVGYLYAREGAPEEKKGVIVFAHGLGGGGQTGYMDIFHYMAGQGYYVFAYDATGNDESEGEVIGGLPQGIADLDHAIDYACALEVLRGLPLLLMGYSWGALSVTNVLCFHPEATAVVSLAGWDRAIDMIEYRGTEAAGEFARLTMPLMEWQERKRYGKYAACSGMEGLAASDCAAMIVHGARDTVIPIAYGYERYYAAYCNDGRFVFKVYEERGHAILTDESGERDMALLAEIAEFFDRSVLP